MELLIIGIVKEKENENGRRIYIRSCGYVNEDVI